MNTTQLGFLTAAAIGLAGTTASAQSSYVAPPVNANAIAFLDMNVPVAGTIAPNDPYFATGQISSITPVGTWTAAGDTVQDPGGLNVFGQCLTVTAGALTITAPNGPLDDAGPGAGFDIDLTQAVDELGLFFVDQAGMQYTAEFFNGATSLGVLNEIYPASFPPIYLRAGSPFDRVEIRFPVGSPGVGLDEITLGNGPGPDPVPDNCLETVFDGRFAGVNQITATGGSYFDLEVLEAGLANSVTISCVADGSGLPIGLNIYTAPDTRIGKEGDMSLWTLRAQGDGNTVAANLWARTEVTLTAPWALPAGTYGVAFQIENAFMVFTGDDGLNGIHTSGDGLMTFTNGAWEEVAFAGDLVNTADPAVPNIGICREAGSVIGSSFCSANVNSTGSPATMQAVGSEFVADNNLSLRISSLPSMQFGIIVVAASAGGGVTPPNSQGTLCLTGPVGRYSLPGEIFQATAGGEVDYSINLNAIRRPAGNVATTPGDTWFFQAWHRDIVSGTPTSNFTSGVQITFN